jgi:hypothetical protein
MKVAATHQKAEEMRAAAAALCEEQAAKARQRADQIRQSGEFSTSLGCFMSYCIIFQDQYSLRASIWSPVLIDPHYSMRHSLISQPQMLLLCAHVPVTRTGGNLKCVN